ncbi:aminotransferase class V-fold PLP-dependent enzyme [Planctomicrobium sp. SH668]|uniref:aminotransferase class V-fold PLP-dependent enzyme n=1 Tax=Planctomicrobium sp. SH668 TaxID=3448126 RepID=UPI003F5C119D
MVDQAFDVTAIRRQFPVFSQVLPKGVPVTYLDTAASAQKPESVIAAEREVYETHYANAYRGVYRFGAQIDEELEASREAVRALIGAASANEIAFTSGTTLGLNTIAFGWGRPHLKAGDEILLNLMEHHANFVPWQQVAKETGAVLRFLPLTDEGELNLSQVDEYINRHTKIVAVTAMSNTLGTLNPIKVLSEKAHAVGAILVVDGAQSVPHGSTNVIDEGIDFLAFSGHKLYGPTGIGVIYGRRELLEKMTPYVFGGHMIDQVKQDSSTWSDIPAKFEAGTIPIVQAITLKYAIDFLNGIGFDAIHKHEQELTAYAFQRLGEIEGLKIYGPPADRRGALISFTIDKAHPEDLAQLLDRKGVFIRHGHHCTMPLHQWLGVSATIRASFGVYNTQEDVDTLVSGIDFALKKLRLR